MDGRAVRALAFIAFVVWLIHGGYSAWWVLAGLCIL